MKQQSEAERKKQALRENLKRRKAQIRDLKNDDGKSLSPRRNSLGSKNGAGPGKSRDWHNQG